MAPLPQPMCHNTGISAQVCFSLDESSLWAPWATYENSAQKTQKKRSLGARLLANPFDVQFCNSTKKQRNTHPCAASCLCAACAVFVFCFNPRPFSGSESYRRHAQVRGSRISRAVYWSPLKRSPLFELPKSSVCLSLLEKNVKNNNMSSSDIDSLQNQQGENTNIPKQMKKRLEKAAPDDTSSQSVPGRRALRHARAALAAAAAAVCGSSSKESFGAQMGACV